MLIKILKETLVGRRVHVAGDVVETSNELARLLLARGTAEIVHAPESEIREAVSEAPRQARKAVAR